MIPDPAQLDAIPKLGVPQDLPRDGIQPRVLDDHLGLFPRGFVVFEVDHAGRETGLELGRVFGRDGGEDIDMREKAVRGRGCGVSRRTWIISLPDLWSSYPLRENSPTGLNLA